MVSTVASESIKPFILASRSGHFFSPKIVKTEGNSAVRTIGATAQSRSAYGGSGNSKYQVRDVAGRVTTPLLITDPDNEQFFPGQPRQLYDLLPGEKQIIEFTQQQGANTT